MKFVQGLFLTICVAAITAAGVLYLAIPSMSSYSSITTTKEQTDKKSAYERVVTSGEIRCGYAMSPPALQQDPNTKELYGLDKDIWAEIGKELDLKIIWAEETGWGNYIAGLESGRYDVFCNQAWPNPGRLKNSHMVGPVTYQTLSAYVRADDFRFDGNIDKINTPETKIPAIDGDVSVTMVKNRFPKASMDTLSQMSTASEMFLSVKTGKSDILFLDDTFYNVFEKAHPGSLRKVKDIGGHIFVYGSYYSMHKDEDRLGRMIDIALKRIIDDGRMEVLARKYSEHYHIPNKGFKVQ